MTLAFEPFGDTALRARLPEGAEGRSLLAALRALPRVVDAVVTESHAMITFDPAAPPEGVAEAMEAALSAPLPAMAPRRHVVRTRYNGPDLDEVARVANMARTDVIALHTAAEYVVSTVGFLPGFAYLRGLDPRLVVPRRSSPRPRVDALSVAIAGPYAGIYPFASPGGWHLLGTAIDFSAFDAASGGAFTLGDRVRFVEADPCR